MKLFFACLLFPVFAFSQQKQLSIGDTLPAELFAMINNTAKSKTPDTERQLIILDFFASFCTGCIKALPKLDSLQEMFTDKLQIIIVANESSEKLEVLRKKNKQFANCTLPVISRDTILKKLFPHKSIPHEAWIDRNGIVKAITSDVYVTAENIGGMLAGKPVKLPVKKDWVDFDPRLPIPQQDLVFRSLITKRIDGLTGKEGMVYNGDSTTKRYFYINRPVKLLYKKVGISGNMDNRIYCYEIIVPAKTSNDQVMQWMHQDLDRFFKQ